VKLQGLKPESPENKDNPRLDANHFMLSGESMPKHAMTPGRSRETDAQLENGQLRTAALPLSHAGSLR
jgi:hypothetical protein